MNKDAQKPEHLVPDLEAGIYLALTQLHELLRDFDLEKLKAEVGSQPREYTALATTLARIGKQALDFERFKQDVRAETEQGKTDGVITPEKLRQIEEALRLL